MAYFEEIHRSPETIIMNDLRPIPVKELMERLEKTLSKMKNPVVSLKELPYGYDTLIALLVKEHE